MSAGRSANFSTFIRSSACLIKRIRRDCLAPFPRQGFSKHWRDRAMRAISDGMKYIWPARLLNDLANDYDKFADRADIRSNGGVLLDK
jgi:hypothetical protein